MLIRLKLNQTIDSHNQKIIDSERKRWKAVLVRLCAILRCMAAQNLAFRGTSSVIHSHHNGNFLKLIECFSLFDNILKHHLEKIKNKEHVHYLGPQIQNELISLMSEKVKTNILTMVKDVKYYSIILDCTPDCSHREQMSIILRFVSTITGDVHEHFIGCIEVFDKTGAGLSERIIKELMDLKININNMRGQSYDNGSNMRGKQNVQKRILNINPRAFYVPCNSHSLNLVYKLRSEMQCRCNFIFWHSSETLCFFFSVY
jgi:hypothetical protein